MRPLAYKVTFVTPAFLGNAKQAGQWRTPPFKALLRQWWRVAYAADHNFKVNVAHMRREEGLLFGNAWLSHYEGGREVADYRKSLLRIRLDRWDNGTLTQWPTPDATVTHPEVNNLRGQPKPVGSQLYLGYGPLVFRNGTAMKGNAAIQAGESAALSIALPAKHTDTEIKRLLEVNAPRIERAVWLMDRYGTLGGRSRNGWGSFSLKPLDGTSASAGEAPLRPWGDALGLDWPHAVGRDESGALIWTTRPFVDWKQLMRELAIIKIGLRTQFVFPNVPPPHQNVEPRHWLSYPVTKHTTHRWNRNARLPNSLRFKVRPAPNDPAKLVGIVFHVPCLPPSEFRPDATAIVNTIVNTWISVHTLLTELTRPTNVRTYASISNASRRSALKPQLNTITLARIPE